MEWLLNPSWTWTCAWGEKTHSFSNECAESLMVSDCTHNSLVQMLNWRNKKRNIGGLKSNAKCCFDISWQKTPSQWIVLLNEKWNDGLHASHIQVSYISKVLTEENDLYKDWILSLLTSMSCVTIVYFFLPVSRWCPNGCEHINGWVGKVLF